MLETMLNQEDRKKLVRYMRNRLDTTDLRFEDVYIIKDSLIERIMTTTFLFIREKFNRCFYCQNHQKFGFSNCKINSHIRGNCFYYTPDIRKMMKRNYYNIMILAHESPDRESRKDGFHIPPIIEKKIIYETIKLYDLYLRQELIKRMIMYDND